MVSFRVTFNVTQDWKLREWSLNYSVIKFATKSCSEIWPKTPHPQWMKEKQLRWKWKDATSLYVFLLSMCWVTEAKPLPWKWIYKFLKGSVASLSWKRLVRWQFTWEISQFVNSDKISTCRSLDEFLLPAI